MIQRRSLLSLLAFIAVGRLVTTPLAAQPPAQSPTQDASAALTVRGVADKSVTLTVADLDKLPQHTAKVKDKSGADLTYDGPSLGDVMKRAGLDFESNLHGRSLTRYLLVEAADKYRIVFSLPEFDSAFTDRIILVATKKDGRLLSADEGPWRIIVPDDKRPARWVRQVRILSIVDSVPPSEQNKKP